MTPAILSYRGHLDGIRWGDVHFDGENVYRRFVHDRLANSVRLYVRDQDAMHRNPTEDVDPERVASTLRSVNRL